MRKSLEKNVEKTRDKKLAMYLTKDEKQGEKFFKEKGGSSDQVKMSGQLFANSYDKYPILTEKTKLTRCKISVLHDG